jgi:exopolysaccharide biosynthesis protein
MKRNKIILTIDLFFAIVLLLTFAFQDNIKNYMIQKRFQNNEYESSNDYQKITFNNSLIIDTNEEKVYDNKYEAEIQNRGENNDYKIIDLTVANNKGWLVVVYDPSDVHIMKSRAFKTPNNDGKENIIDMTKRYGATIGVNGGGFYDDGKVSKDIPFGYIIENGKVIYKSHSRESDIIGMSNDNKLMLVHATGEKAVEMGMRDGLEFGPFLIIDGKRQTNLKPTKAARNMIAQRDDGIILFLVTDGLSYSGITFNEGIDVLEKYGATTAANLDGGASTQLVVNGELLNSPKNALGIPIPKGRTVVNGWGVFID